MFCKYTKKIEKTTTRVNVQGFGLKGVRWVRVGKCSKISDSYRTDKASIHPFFYFIFYKVGFAFLNQAGIVNYRAKRIKAAQMFASKTF